MYSQTLIYVLSNAANFDLFRCTSNRGTSSVQHAALTSLGRTRSGGKAARPSHSIVGIQKIDKVYNRHTEDGCPRRFEVMTRQAQTEGSGRRQSALPIRHHGLPPQQVAPQHMQLG